MEVPDRVNAVSLAAGVVSVVLGVIGLLFFFVPIIGIPVSMLAFLAGLIGCGLSIRTSLESLRWGLVGIVVSAVSIGIDAAIIHAPAGGLQPYERPENPSTRDRPFVPPPASLPGQ